jgi:hypothetical protein
VQLTSWKNPFDPSLGNFSTGIDVRNLPEFFVWNDGSPYWRSSPWNSRVFIGVQKMNYVYLDGFSLVDDKEGTFYFTFSYPKESFRKDFVLNAQGNL